ncbi:iron chaperone [Paenibacillus sp. NPDC058071]|uniref:iron chaperone n=1 Tax=Paenibacillus sp. NPDC058071 TaxID=3346326 RepID=UPI0036DCE54D
MDKKSYESIDHYIADASSEAQPILRKLREVIREAAPDAVETISYQMPTFALNGPVVHFAAFKNHIGLYPAPSGIDRFEEELKPYRTGKGTLQFPFDQPLPYPLISRIVAYRVAANREKAAAKRKKKV